MKKIILVVDDVPNNIKILKSVLEQQDYTIRAATSGEKALKLVTKTPAPDLVLLDIMMPEMDGIEVCTRLKQDSNTANIPVIFISAKDDAANQSVCFNAGAVDYITKPFKADDVLTRVAKYL